MRFLFNFLATSGTAMFAGVMFMINLTLGEFWKSLTPEDFLNWFSVNSHFIMNSIPFVIIPTIIGLIGSLWFDWNKTSQRTLWIVSFASILTILLLTLFWFVPTNNAFAAKSIQFDFVPNLLKTWLLIHWIRIALAIFASAMCFLAISKPKEN